MEMYIFVSRLCDSWQPGHMLVGFFLSQVDHGTKRRGEELC